MPARDPERTLLNDTLNVSWIAHGERTLRSKQADVVAAWCATHALCRQRGYSGADRERGRLFASRKRWHQTSWDHRSSAAPGVERAYRRGRGSRTRRGMSTGKSDTLRQDGGHKLVTRVAS